MDLIKEVYAFIITSRLRQDIITTLSKRPLRQSEIVVKLNKKQPNISIALRDLENKKLIECITPNKKSWKVYELTELGRLALMFKNQKENQNYF